MAIKKIGTMSELRRKLLLFVQKKAELEAENNDIERRMKEIKEISKVQKPFLHPALIREYDRIHERLLKNNIIINNILLQVNDIERAFYHRYGYNIRNLELFDDEVRRS